MPNPLTGGEVAGRLPPDPASTQSLPRPARFPCFDGLRAIASLAVFVCHSSGWLWYVREGWAPVVVQSSLARLGYWGVAVFFVISGFLLYRPFVLAHLEGRPTPRVRAFWFRRFVRVVPAYWVALLAAWLLFGLMAIPTLTDGIMYFGLLQTYRAGYKFVGIGVAWTLVIEVSFYIALPVIAYGLRRLSSANATPQAKLRAQLIGLVALGLFSVVARALFLWDWAVESAPVGSWFPMNHAAVWLVGYLDWFAVGMIMATASAWREIGGRLPRVVEYLGERPWLCWVISGSFLVLITRVKYPWLPRFLLNANETVTTEQELLRFTFTLVAAGFLVFPAVFGNQEQGAIRKLLRSRVMVGLGLISYGIYLWHDPLWKVSFDWVRRGLIPSGPVAQFAIVFVLTILAAAASYFVIERPLRMWVQRRTRVRSAPR